MQPDNALALMVFGHGAGTPKRAPLMHQMSSALAPETLMVSKAGIFVWPCRTTPSSTQRAQALPSSSPSLVCPLPSPLLHPSHFLYVLRALD